jgi:stage II sporulation protein P
MQERMKKAPKKNRRNGRRLRRVGALAMAFFVMTALSQTTGGGILRQFLGSALENGAVSKAILGVELGYVPEGALSARLNAWEAMVLSQSAVLRAGEAAAVSLEEEEERAGATGLGLPGAASPAPTEAQTPSPVPTSNGEIKARTFQAISSTSYDQADGVYIFNRTSQTVNVAELSQTKPDLKLQNAEEGPQVLIVHTHGSEAYHPEGEDQYTATGDARTTDEAHNVVRVGDELQKVLEEGGISVIHDKVLHDYPAYRGSYERSIKTVNAYLEKHPTIRVVFDLHRDALMGSDGTIYKPVTTIDGEQVAQIMLVMGSNDGGLSHPSWRENVRFAIWLQKRINAEYPTLARPMSLRSSRYNQQLSTGSLLIEVGSHGNSLQEALGAIRLFGKSLAGLLREWGAG